MADGKIVVDTEINTDGVEKGINNIKNSFSKLKATGMAGVIAAEVKAIKDLGKAIKDTSDAYNLQVKGETQLKNAVKNNPYLNDNSVKNLENFASKMQEITTLGDDYLLPFMAQLASTGRTEAEIMKIIQAAADVSASGLMSFDSAVQQLNASFSGNVGLMGRQVAELKDLTAEELKAGKAVDIIAQKYNGLAESTTKATGSYEQMKNAQGDFAEAVGQITKPTADLWNNFWKGWYEKGIEAVNKINTALETKTTRTMLEKQLKNIDDENDRFLEIQETVNDLTDEEVVALNKYYQNKKKLNDNQKEILGYLAAESTIRESNLQKAEKEKAEADKKAKAEAEAAQAEEKKEKTRQDIIDEYNKSMDEYLEKKKLEAQFNAEGFDDQDVLNERMRAYVELVMQLADGENDPFAKEKRDEILQYAQYVGQLGAEFVQTEEAVEEFKVSIDEVLADLKEYFSEFNNITQQSVELARMSNEEETKKAQGELAKQYNDGLISYEEYNEKKKEIDKKTAREEYKLKMWEWSSSLLTATANIAEGVSKAIAQGGIAGIITGALVAASGSLQLATITANKPMAPSFATGGIVQGTSYTGDNVRANVNSGEMILNANQQANLWRLANGRSGGGANINMPITIENKNGSSVRTQFNKNGLRVIVDDMVNASMQRGSYTQSMNIANSRQNGGRIL